MTSNVDRQAVTVATAGPYELGAGEPAEAASGAPVIDLTDPFTAHRLKPRLRGWLHVAATPVALAAGLLVAGHVTSAAGRTGALIFLVSSVLLFGISGLFHRFNWSVATYRLLRRIDHSNIYLFIAASYTPYALCLLSGASRASLLALVWTTAVAGLLFRTLWLSAPRRLYTLMYVLMAGSAAGWLPQFLHQTNIGIFSLMLGSGVAYVIGAVVYAFRWPDPSPRWFGYHEVFHSCTVAAFVLQLIAMSLVITAP